MNCEQVQEFISQFIDGELDTLHEPEVFRHLGACEQCRAFLKNVLSLRNSLAGTSIVAVPPSLDRRVLNPISMEKKLPLNQQFNPFHGNARYSFRVVGFAVLFTALTSIFVSSVWYQNHQPQSTIVCLTPLPEVEVNGYVITASVPTKGINE